MGHSSHSLQNHGRIIAECKALCPVPSLVEHTLSIHPPSPSQWQETQDRSTLSMRRRMEKRINLILLIQSRLWLTCQHLMLLPHLLSLTLILAPLYLVEYLLLPYHHLHLFSVLPCPLVAHSLFRLPLFPLQSISELLRHPTLLWAQHILSLPVA